MISAINNQLTRLRNQVRRFTRDNKGVAAVEFAFIAPLLITLYLGTQEISLALNINKKVGRTSSAIGDLVAQETDEVVVADLRDIMKVGAATMQPYSITKPEVWVTGIQISATGAATVAWSQRLVDNITYSVPYPAGSAVATVPVKLKVNSTFLVKVETKLKYRPITSWTITTNKSSGYAYFDMAEIYYLRPRNSDSLLCIGC
jgi:Flp pilus assembly protein TadG